MSDLGLKFSEHVRKRCMNKCAENLGVSRPPPLRPQRRGLTRPCKQIILPIKHKLPPHHTHASNPKRPVFITPARQTKRSLKSHRSRSSAKPEAGLRKRSPRPGVLAAVAQLGGVCTVIMNPNSSSRARTAFSAVRLHVFVSRPPIDSASTYIHRDQSHEGARGTCHV